MSGKDDPFGSGGKTVIRPNPGGAMRPDQMRPLPDAAPRPMPQRPQPGGHQATVITPMPAPVPPSQPGPFGSPPPSGPFGAPPPAGGFGSPPPQRGHGLPPGAAESWMIGADLKNNFHVGDQKPAAPTTPTRKIPLEVALNARDAGGYSASNPITAAAAPLLILLGRLRLGIVDMQAVPLMNHVADSIIGFEKKVLEAGVSREDAQVAKYALCGTADDIVQNLPGTDRHVWMQYSMLARFFQVRTSGVGFFEELNKILANPAPRFNLLELMHACLSLGFEGQFRGSAGGDNELQRIRRDVYQTLRHLQARPDDDISPRWRGLSVMMRDLRSRVPVWALGSGAALLLVGVYMLLRFLLANDGDAIAQRMLALHPGEQITIERSALAPTPLPYVGQDYSDQTQLERIREALAEDIAAGGVKVEGVGERIIIGVNNLILFASGKAEVKKEFAPVAQRIAQALESEPGPINIIGHTDNVPLSGTGSFKSNFDLSVARARSVEKVVAEGITDKTRLVVEGKGEDEPIADNKTPEGRAQNRRVEIMIPRAETLE
jgi:type VI secretion system protein ImpK